MTVQEISARPLEDLLAASAASAPFKQAIRDLSAGRPQNLILANAGSPPVKIARVVTKLIEAYPEIAFEKLDVEGQSGCSEYFGKAVAQPGNHRFEFEWDCRWRAEERGWVDGFGDPDQIRAARTLGYQCFRKLEKL